jgi:prepilin-type processing-associated H-X9-DG protein
MRRDTRGGITLIELLVVVAVAVVLLAILLTVVRTAQAQARRASCINNLKQLGLGLHNYVATSDALPMSVVYGEGHGNGQSCFTLVLPFMDQVATYNAYNFHLEPWHIANGTSVQTKVDTFLCPDNKDVADTPAWEVRFPESRSVFAKGHYGANWGGGRGVWGEDFAKEKGTYLGVMMAVRNEDGQVKAPDGRPRGRNVSFAHITDGLSSTLLVVEKRDSFGWAVGGWGGSEFDVNTTPGYQGDDVIARKVYTGSPHADGPHALMCDGSVRALPARQDKKIWYRIITRAGGEVVRFTD